MRINLFCADYLLTYILKIILEMKTEKIKNTKNKIRDITLSISFYIIFCKNKVFIPAHVG